MVRTPGCDKSTGLRKGTWTPEEDRKLKAYVTRYGCWNWRQLPKYAGLARCGKSCRLRWLNYLRPNIKRGNYTKEEEETIIRLHESLGNRWSAIAAELPGRTDNEVKNHWNTNLKKRFKDHHKMRLETKKGGGVDELNCGTSTKEKREDKSQINHHLFINIPTSPPLILESSLSSPQSASSDQNSSITKDSTVDSSKDSVTFADCYNNNNNNNEVSFDAYEAVSGNFWNEPFFSENFNTNHITNTMDTVGYEFDEFPFLYDEIGFYDQLEGFYF